MELVAHALFWTSAYMLIGCCVGGLFIAFCADEHVEPRSTMMVTIFWVPYVALLMAGAIILLLVPIFDRNPYRGRKYRG